MSKEKKEKKKTQKAKVLEYLLANSRFIKKTGKNFFYNSITPIDALTMFGTFRLSAIIFDLKADGYAFETTFVKNEYGNSFASYKLT